MNRPPHMPTERPASMPANKSQGIMRLQARHQQQEQVMQGFSDLLQELQRIEQQNAQLMQKVVQSNQDIAAALQGVAQSNQRIAMAVAQLAQPRKRVAIRDRDGRVTESHDVPMGSMQ